jgi:hypothetical protein
MRRADKLHHGDCIGGDAEIHAIALIHRVWIEVWPPDIDTYRAYCTGYKVRHPLLPYKTRNGRIVQVCTELWGFPKQNEEMVRGSGTWQCMRQAMRQGRALYIVFRDGTIVPGEEWAWKDLSRKASRQR